MEIPKEFEDVFLGLELTDGEIRTLVWITGWERQTVENLRFVIQKAQGTALSTLQAENEKLRKELEWKDMVIELAQRKEREAKAELEQVKRERDAAVSWAQKYTESIDRPCVACKHNTGDYVCTAICGNCGPMGTESCKWEFDFSGELKED